MVLTIKKDDIGIDLKVNDKQKIIDVVGVMVEKGLFVMPKSYQMESIRNNIEIDASKSFDENNIFNGDILLIKSKE